MNGTVNHPHYFPKDLDPAIKELAEAHKLNEPRFVGQGLCKSVGSDCYGYYITEIKDIGRNKRIFGIVSADTVMHGSSWVEGDMDCSMPADKTPTRWICKYGKSWYFCDKDGKRFPGKKCRYSFRGCHAFRDPSF